MPTDLSELKGSLILFDLGYVGRSNLKKLHEAGVKFLCRHRKYSKGTVTNFHTSNRNLRRLITKVNYWDPERFKGKYFGKYIKLSVSLGMKITPIRYPECDCFVHGIWNEESGEYHWYYTNLDSEPKLTYPLYRLRWQIELFFKSAKSYMNLAKITSASKTIILNLILASLISFLITMPLIAILLKKEILYASTQRIAIFLQKISDILNDIIIRENFNQKLEHLKKIFLKWKKELFDPNLYQRPNSMMTCMANLERL